jgi:hypothetical protein
VLDFKDSGLSIGEYSLTENNPNTNEIKPDDNPKIISSPKTSKR